MMNMSLLCRSRRPPGPAWHDDVRRGLDAPRPAAPAALLRRQRRERRRVLAELARLLERNPFLDP